MTKEEALQASQQMLKSIFTPIIRVYGEAIVELGGKEYIIDAPEGVTIRERGSHEGWDSGTGASKYPRQDLG